MTFAAIKLSKKMSHARLALSPGPATSRISKMRFLTCMFASVPPDERERNPGGCDPTRYDHHPDGHAQEVVAAAEVHVAQPQPFGAAGLLQLARKFRALGDERAAGQRHISEFVPIR